MQIEKLHLISHLSFHLAFEDTLRHPDLKVDLGLCAVNLAVQYKRWVIYNIVDSMINHGLQYAYQLHNVLPFLPFGKCGSLLHFFMEIDIKSRRFSCLWENKAW